MIDLWEKPSLLDPLYFKLVAYCYKQAARETQMIHFKGHDIEIDAGEFVLGRDTLANDMNRGISKKDHLSDLTWLRRLKDLEAEAIVSLRSTNKYTIVKIALDSFDVIPKTAEKEVAVGTEHPPQEKTSEPEQKPKKPKAEKIAKVYEPDDEAYKMAEYIYDEMSKLLGEGYTRSIIPNYQQWAAEIDTLLNPSKGTRKPIADTYEERLPIMWDVLEWAMKSYYKGNCRTAKKFVKDFRNIRMYMDADKIKQRDKEEALKQRSEHWSANRPKNKQQRMKELLDFENDEADRKIIDIGGNYNNLLFLGGPNDDGK